MTNECTLSAGHFDGHGGTPEQYRWHCPMGHVQGYSRSHWMPASGDYSLRIAPAAAAGQQANKQHSTNTPKKLAILMAMAMRRYVTVHIARWRRFRSLLDATKHRHWASIAADSCNRSCMCRFIMSFFIVNSYKKVAG